MADLSATVFDLIDQIVEDAAGRSRYLIAITGAPGSGKSTLASELLRRLSQKKQTAALVRMDGYLLDNSLLDDMGLLPRKGSPETLDAHGFINLVQRLRSGEEAFVPRYDAQRDVAIAGAGHVPSTCPLVIVEGEYLMFDEDPWRRLAPLWDLTIRCAVPAAELRGRLIQKQLSLNLPRTVAVRRAEGNDIPNAQRVIDRALACDILLDGTPGK